MKRPWIALALGVVVVVSGGGCVAPGPDPAATEDPMITEPTAVVPEP